MLDFYSIEDAQPKYVSPKQLTYLGGIEWAEFETAQKARIIEAHLDYYGDFSWSSELVRRKLSALAELNPLPMGKLMAILKKAAAAERGVKAFGD
ncbi:hypothetical protein IC235_08350 [Hymenobacter sp. BT664]|uniref:Uncharacterized protein n=1 Tax=Hymenobacter montanus TaxID=2771359 RepID=A0A927GIX6_9BACT|nr:hypothetical protein [Hymenobacter montanus]MBD2767903.1 hypothetical protein [Hymenobacter montanus]